jgi:hypothetical protein
VTIDQDIEKYKKSLLKKAKQKGLYENFGQNEVRKLEDKYKCNTDYSDKGRETWEKIQGFNKWCMSLDDNDLR